MNAESEPSNEAPAGITEAEVRDYLKQHNDFLEQNPDMLDYLHITHDTGKAVSLVEKQVSVLRERNIDMRKRLNHLTSNARDNDELYERTRRLSLQLLDATTLDELCGAFLNAMAEDFAVEHASVILFGDPAESTGHCRIEPTESARREIGALIRGGSAVCGTLRKEELQYLFPGAAGMGSAAVMPLSRGGEMGLIAVGSSDAHRYPSGMGTLFLSHIADIMVRLVPRLRPGSAEGNSD